MQQYNYNGMTKSGTDVIIRELTKIDKKIDTLEAEVRSLKETQTFYKGAVWGVGILVAGAGALVATLISYLK
jgi:hypothetical protein